MDLEKIAVESLGAAGMVLLFVSFIQKRRKNLHIWQSMANVTLASYSHMTASMMNTVINMVFLGVNTTQAYRYRHEIAPVENNFLSADELSALPRELVTDIHSGLQDTLDIYVAQSDRFSSISSRIGYKGSNPWEKRVNELSDYLTKTVIPLLEE